MKSNFGIAVLIVLSCISFSMSTNLLGKHKTMKLGICACEDNMHKGKPIHEFKKHEFMAIGVGGQVGAVAVSQMVLEHGLSNQRNTLKPHYFVNYREQQFNNVTRSLMQEQPVLIFLDDKNPLGGAREVQLLYFWSDTKTPVSVTGFPFAGTILFPQENGVDYDGKEGGIVVVKIGDLDKAKISWDSTIIVTSNDGNYRYDLLFAPQNVPVNAETTQGKVRPTQQQAAYAMFGLAQITSSKRSEIANFNIQNRI